MGDWQPIETAPQGELILTKIHDADGARNVAWLKRDGRLWWLRDGSMYVYYQPTHWQCPPPVQRDPEGRKRVDDR
jgi:hypothetical protein